MAQKIVLPVKITEELMQRADRARETMAQKAGIPVTRTAFVEKAIAELCSRVEERPLEFYAKGYVSTLNGLVKVKAGEDWKEVLKRENKAFADRMSMATGDEIGEALK